MFNNIGLQWFVPYILAIFVRLFSKASEQVLTLPLQLLAIPGLILEVSVGQAYRGGPVVSFNSVHHRMRGVGLASVVGETVSALLFETKECLHS